LSIDALSIDALSIDALSIDALSIDALSIAALGSAGPQCVLSGGAGRAGFLELDEDRVRGCVTDVLTGVLLRAEPPRLTGGELDLHLAPARRDSPAEAAERVHHAVRVPVHRGPFSRLIVVFQHSGPVVLENHGVVVAVRQRGIEFHRCRRLFHQAGCSPGAFVYGTTVPSWAWEYHMRQQADTGRRRVPMMRLSLPPGV